MLSFSISFFLGYERWEYRCNLGRPSVKNRPTAQTARPSKQSSHRQKASQTQTRRDDASAASKLRATSRELTSSDTSFNSLSSEGQEVQQRTRDLHRERMADRISLDMLLAASDVAKARRKRYHQYQGDADAETSQALDNVTEGDEQTDVSAGLEREVQVRGSSGLSESWSTIGGAESMVEGGSDGPESKENPDSSNIPESSASSESSEDPDSSDAIGAIETSEDSDSADGDQSTKAAEDSTELCKALNLDAVAEEARKQRSRTPSPEELSDHYIKPRLLFKQRSGGPEHNASTDGSHYYESDPFGSALVEDGATKEARLQKSLSQYRRVGSVHSLYLSLRAKDREERAEPEKMPGDSSSPRSGNIATSSEDVHEDADVDYATADGQQPDAHVDDDEDWLMV